MTEQVLKLLGDVVAPFSIGADLRTRVDAAVALADEFDVEFRKGFGERAEVVGDALAEGGASGRPLGEGGGGLVGGESFGGVTRDPLGVAFVERQIGHAGTPARSGTEGGVLYAIRGRMAPKPIPRPPPHFSSLSCRSDSITSCRWISVGLICTAMRYARIAFWFIPSFCWHCPIPAHAP